MQKTSEGGHLICHSLILPTPAAYASIIYITPQASPLCPGHHVVQNQTILLREESGCSILRQPGQIHLLVTFQFSKNNHRHG